MLIRDKRKEWEGLGMGPVKRLRTNMAAQEAADFIPFLPQG